LLTKKTGDFLMKTLLMLALAFSFVSCNKQAEQTGEQPAVETAAPAEAAPAAPAEGAPAETAPAAHEEGN
jgi:hypothetical protein